MQIIRYYRQIVLIYMLYILTYNYRGGNVLQSKRGEYFHMRSILMINQLPINEHELESNEDMQLAEKLEAVGYIVYVADCTEQVKNQISVADAIVLNMSLQETKSWTHKLMQWKRLPLLWWCSITTSHYSKDFCDSDILLDGLLSPKMNEEEIHWAFYFASKQCFERQQWLTERKLLEDKLEERKWIELAKSILCKIKNISEAEAYDMLRKQAMNERKRLVDVASSIVKVYQLLEKK